MKFGRAAVIVGAIAVAIALSTPTPRAQSRQPLTLVSLADTPRVQDVQLSPDGRFVWSTLARADWRANRLVGHILAPGRERRDTGSGDAREFRRIRVTLVAGQQQAVVPRPH